MRPLYVLMVVLHLHPIFAERPSSPVFWIRPLGIVLLAIGVAWRLWALGVLRKKKELALIGPYAHTRNPLYLGTFLIGFGASLAASWPWGALLACVYALVFHWLYASQIRAEEQWLAPVFGARYQRYLENVPRFWPRLSSWRTPAASGHFSFRNLLRNHAVALLAGIALLLLLMDFTSGVAAAVLRDEGDPGPPGVSAVSRGGSAAPSRSARGPAPPGAPSSAAASPDAG